MSLSLNNLKEGEKGAVLSISNLENRIVKRLIEMGFVHGEKIEVIRRLNGLIIVGLRSFALAIDSMLASKITIERAI